jgi:hypothetical protein
MYTSSRPCGGFIVSAAILLGADMLIPVVSGGFVYIVYSFFDENLGFSLGPQPISDR